MSIFKINRRALERISNDIINDMGEDLVEELRDEYSHLKSYYGESDLVCSIVYDDKDHVVGSEEWGIAASDTGQDWNWGSLPPIDKIAEWVRNDKDGGVYSTASDKEVNEIAYRVAMKIRDEGIESSFWVDGSLLYFTSQRGASGSGRE